MEPAVSTDRRVAYGAMCTWWDLIDNVGLLNTGSGVPLPCCPHCKGLLMEVRTPESWWASVARYEAKGNPGYGDFIRWLRGRCFKTKDAAQAQYAIERPSPRQA
jgi:hypothetical protein